MQWVDKYLDSIKGVGVYRANVDRYAINPPQYFSPHPVRTEASE